jgi:hypothetical protein
MLNVAQIESFTATSSKRNTRIISISSSKAKTTLSVCNSFLELVDKEYSLHSVGDSLFMGLLSVSVSVLA